MSDVTLTSNVNSAAAPAVSASRARSLTRVARIPPLAARRLRSGRSAEAGARASTPHLSGRVSRGAERRSSPGRIVAWRDLAHPLDGGDGVLAGADVELAQDVLHVGAHRLRREDQLIGDGL